MNLVDQFNRHINYLRISVTDRCDLRCIYCMKEKMTFLPKNEILTLEEIERLCDNFIEMGVKKIRLTGGEPLVRKDIIKLITSQKDVLPIENIMLHLRCRGLLNNTRFERLKTIMMGLPFAWLLNILMFPITLLSFMASRLFVISFATPFVPYWLDMISLT